MKHELVQKIREHYPGFKENSLGGASLKTGLEDLKKTLRWLKKEAGFLFLVDLYAVDHGLEAQERFEVKYDLLNLENYFRLQVCAFLKTSEKERLADVTDLWPNALWPSQEAWDLFGIAYLGQNKERIYNPGDFSGHPLLKDFRARPWEEVFRDHENYRAPLPRESVVPGKLKRQWQYIDARPRGATLLGFKFQEDSEKMITKMQPQIGLSHRGIEKLCESTNYLQMTRWTSKINSLCSETFNTAWVMALEKLCGLQVPQKAQAMRMVCIEIERICSHLNTLYHATKEVGLSDLADLLCLQLESFARLSFDLSQRRFNTEFVCFGGLRGNYPQGWMTSCFDVLKQAQKTTEEVNRHLTRSHQWMERSKSASITSYEALNWGLSGPTLRACGVNFDLRKSDPFYFYKDVDFQIPLGINGDSYDRFLVRIEETFQSISVVNQILDHMPTGPHYDGDQVDSLKTQNNKIEVAQGEIYTALESANGEFGVGIFSKNENCPERVRFRTPGFYSAQSIGSVFNSLDWEQAWVAIHSFNLEHGEVDK